MTGEVPPSTRENTRRPRATQFQDRFHGRGEISLNFRSPTTVDTSVYKDYVDVYEWRPGDDLETISVKGGRLWTELGNDREEFFPLGADQFFLRNDLGVNKFTRDAQGRIIGYSYQDADGQEIHIKKIR